MASPAPRPPSLLAQPAYLAAQVGELGRRQLEDALAPHGLPLGLHALLSALDDLGPLSQQALADSLALDKSHLVGRIDQLEGRGLVERTPDASDRRRNQVALTPAGRTLLSELRPVLRRAQERSLTSLSPAEQETLVSLLRRVLAASDADRQVV